MLLQGFRCLNEQSHVIAANAMGEILHSMYTNKDETVMFISVFMDKKPLLHASVSYCVRVDAHDA